jgi:hypothetical protein
LTDIICSIDVREHGNILEIRQLCGNVSTEKEICSNKK